MSETEEVDCYDPNSGLHFRIEGPVESDADIQGQLLDLFHKGIIISGESTFVQDGAYYDDERGTLNVSGLENVEYGEIDPSKRRRRLAVTIGTRTMLAVRVIGSDVATTATESEISDSWFGTSGDPVNLKSQIAACSYGKLTMNAATSDSISNGVTTVSISNTVTGSFRKDIENAVVSSLGSLATEFDHTMLCIPPGTLSETSGDWIGYFYFNAKRSVHNDEWCGYVSHQMQGKYSTMIILPQGGYYFHFIPNKRFFS